MPDPDAEIDVEAAAGILGFSRAHVLELLGLGALPFHIVDGVQRLWRSDVEAYRDLRQRRRAALTEITRIVEESAGGWDQ